MEYVKGIGSAWTIKQGGLRRGDVVKELVNRKGYLEKPERYSNDMFCLVCCCLNAAFTYPLTEQQS